MATLVTCAAIVALAPSATAIDHFPLTGGISREYDYVLPQESGTYTTYFSGTVDVGQTTAHVLHHVGGVDDGLLHFWSETPEGDKLFHGFQLGTWVVHWSPPIVRIDEPLYLGKSWDSYSQSSDGLNLHVHCEVLAAGPVTVPAGTFEALTIEETDEITNPPGKMTRHAVTGVRAFADTTQFVSQYSYADSIGQLQWQLSLALRTDRLLSIGIMAVHSSTWSRVRALYR